MSLAVVIVNYNTRAQTLECLDSLVGEVGPDAEIVVVDNGSADGSAQAIRARHPDVVVDEAGENLGFAKGVNRGIRLTSADRVLLLNPDTLVRSGSLRALEAFADAHPEYGVYGGRTLRPDGTTDPSSCWGAPTLWSLMCFASGLTTAFKRSRWFDPESLGRWERDTVREVPIVTGCLLLTNRADWERLGGLDERFFLYGEDAEFSIRAARAGLRPVIVPDAVIVHDVGGSTGSWGQKMSMVMAGKSTLLRTAWTPVRARAGLGLLSAGAALRAGLERAAGRRDGTWTVVWRRRADWRPGYPHATRALFPAAEGERTVPAP